MTTALKTRQVCRHHRSALHMLVAGKEASKFAVFSVYRSYLRRSRQLPHGYLRQFFRIKAEDDARAILETSSVGRLRQKRVKRVSKDIRQLQKALNGDKFAFEHILDLAYGRKGKLKWEIMQPLLGDPNAPLEPPIIPANQKSRPPVYSPELTALLTSTHSRTTKALDKEQLRSPYTLPTRADPQSEEARLLGPFSKRREVNIRWRFFKREWQKVLPPLQLSVIKRDDRQGGAGTISDTNGIVKAGVRPVGLQGVSLLEEAQKLAGPAWKPSSTPRRARLIHSGGLEPTNEKNLFSSKLPSRWLRKRYQNLLGKLPVLNYTYKDAATVNNRPGRYDITLSPSSLSPHIRYGAQRLPPIDSSSLSWFQLTEKEPKHGQHGKKTMSVKTIANADDNK